MQDCSAISGIPIKKKKFATNHIDFRGIIHMQEFEHNICASGKKVHKAQTLYCVGVLFNA